MQIAVRQLTVTVIIVPVVWNVYLQRIFTHPGFPTLVQIHYRAAIFYFGSRKMHFRAPHGFAGSHANATLIVFIHAAIEMIHYTFVINYITFVGKQIVIIFGRCNQIFALPVVPMNEVVTARKSIVSFVGFVGIECRKIEHDIQVTKLLNLCITRNHPLNFVRKNRISRVTFPGFQVVGQSNANTFTFQFGFRMNSSGIVIHHKRSAEGFLFVPINGAFVLNQVFKPLCIFVFVGKNGCGCRFPFDGFTQVFRVGPGQPNAQRTLLVTSCRTTDIRHPILIFVGLQFVASAPGHIGQSRKSSPLVAVPHAIAISQHTAFDVPF